jgi:hypothetical protein
MGNIEERKYSDVTESIALAIGNYLKGEGEFDLDIEKIKLKLYIRGPKWRGVVDKPVAEFLLALDRKLEEEFENLGISLPKFERGIVAIGVQEGSFDGFLMVVPETAEYLMQLAAAQKVIVVATVMTALGAWKVLRKSVPSDGMSLVEAQRFADQAVTLKQINSIEENQAKIEKPFKDFLKKATDPQDQVMTPAGTEPVLVADAVKDLPKGRRAPAVRGDIHYVDGSYAIEALNSPRDKPWSVRLRYGIDLKFAARLDLPQEAMSSLLREYEEAKKLDREVAPSLQVTAQFSPGNKIKGAFVSGLGDPRGGTLKMSEAMAKGNGKNTVKN